MKIVSSDVCLRRRGDNPHVWVPFARRMGIVSLATSLGCLALSSGQPAWSSTSTKSDPPVKVAAPRVEGPILPSSAISFIGSTIFPLSQVGYEESEFFLSGTATAYRSSTALSGNGKWHVTPETTAPYKTRIVVYRPIDPRRFDGIVAVEWLNVTGGVDAGAAWLSGHLEMIRSGMAYVGVDAQAGGINGESGSIATIAGVGGIKQTDPSRYASLHHPGDSFSYSIFEQTGEALHVDGPEILGGLEPEHLVAVGESQSAFYLVTYIDALQPLSPGNYDAYFVYSRGGNAADLSQPPQTTIAAPTPTYIRTDLHVPVFLFETEADLVSLGYRLARQAPTKYIREWEVAGSAHDDTYGLLYSRSDNGNGVADTKAFQSMVTPLNDPIPGIIDCPVPVNAGSHTYELRAAIAAVNKWITTGDPPPQSPRLEIDTADPSRFLTDENGNALGGIRTPQVAAPVAKLSGVGQPATTPSPSSHPSSSKSAVSAGALCGIFGTTIPFSSEKLASLYPTHGAFVRKWDASVAAAVRARYLLPADARVLDRVAAQSKVGG